MKFFYFCFIFFIVLFSILTFVLYRQKKAKYLRVQRKNEAKEKALREHEEREKEFEKANKQREEFIKNKRIEFKNIVDSIPLFEISVKNEKHNRNQEINIIDKEFPNITNKTPIKKLKDFVAVDVETTGLKTGGNDIIQLSAVKYMDFKAVEAFNTLIKPRNHIPMEASEINGITDDMVEDAPTFAQIIDSFEEFIEQLPLVAHNAPFDTKHLYVNGMSSVLDRTVYDTLSLCRKLYKDAVSHKLGDMCELNNIFMSNAHDALYDSYAAGELFKCIISDIREIDINDLFSVE